MQGRRGSRGRSGHSPYKFFEIVRFSEILTFRRKTVVLLLLVKIKDFDLLENL